MRRLIVAAVIIYAALVAGGMAFGSYVHHRRSLMTFKISIPSGSEVKIYADLGGDAPFQYNPAKPLFTVRSGQTITTKVGVYDFVIENATDYQSNIKKITVNKATTQVSINPDYSTTKLNTMLVQQKGPIVAALNAKFPTLTQYYSVDKVELYKQGEWAGVLLKPLSSTYDPVRLILNETGGKWAVVNQPAIMVLGSLYKNIPPDVASSVNAWQ